MGQKSENEVSLETAALESPSLKEQLVKSHRLSWYYAPSFLLLWLCLFFAIVIPLYNRLPERITISEELARPGEFVAERAQSQLFVYDRIGQKVTGGYANEVTTVAFLLNEVEKIKQQMLSDLYELEVDVQAPSGSFSLGSMVSMYQGIQNVVVKLSTKQSQSESYLLINSHFDSKPGSPGSGDDGTMVVVMLEVLRQMAISKTPFEHPIIFLFNGAEELGLQASHGFIMHHKRAANCKMVINLEVGGSGGRDLLFQSGPNKPWLMKYYKLYAKHPFATTIGEEIFQEGILPSDTDFRIFRDFGNVPGLDMAQTDNGYVYHTAFDTFDVVPGRSIQNTGDNILALVRGYTNASELSEERSDDEGHAIFFDFLGLFFVYYTETTGIIMNCCIAVISLVLVGCSLWRMARQSEKVTIPQICLWFLIILGLHVVGVILCFCLPLLMAVIFDAGDRSMTYYSSNWLVFGLYICPAVIGLVLPLTLYLTLKPHDKLSHGYHLQMCLHSHLVVQALLAIILTAMGMRFVYICLMAMIFYGGALLINLLSTLHDRGNYWALIVMCLQVLPFCYFCYIFYILLVVYFPITGRNGIGSNPDIMIALICGGATLFTLGFIAQFINAFRWPKLILFGLGVITFIFSMIAVSEVGFPYRAKTHVMRFNFMDTHRMFYEYNGTMSHSDFGYYFSYQDRRGLSPLQDSNVDLTGIVSMEEFCDDYVMCGAPCYYSCGGRRRARWLPRESGIQMPGEVILEFLGKTVSEANKTVRFNFELTGPSQMNIFIQPVGEAKVTDWSFLQDIRERYQPPYHIFFSYGIDNSPFKFFVELTNSDLDYNVPVLEIAVVGHFASPEYTRDANVLKFIAELPDFVDVMEWPAQFKRYIF
ncbi:endoplasmic reticulum metallopeptidase 1-like [Drosophila serrata]|uniref:endoplasmic reticulum metallopeptidase 1-like n=1 Tax=Drosophila serrata TaxID=7274 RepID=UPI000A1D2CD9|nr:endoplasmic reticulum metallopeptidase 1-like [Drosophila serrata]